MYLHTALSLLSHEFAKMEITHCIEIGIDYFCIMKVIRNCSLALLAALSLGGCDNFEYHPYSIDIHGNHDINRQSIQTLDALKIKPPFKFAFITDTQGSYDDTKEALRSIKERGDIDFIINGGDVSDFGLPKEFVWSRDMFDAAGIPYITIIGNHDCLGNGKQTFEYIYGDTNFSFNVGNTHFVCLNTIALEYDYSHPVPDLDFIEEDAMAVAAINEAQPATITHTVVAMHSRPYDEQFNNNVAKPFNHYLQRYPGMGEDAPVHDHDINDHIPAGSKLRGFCINGHNHNMFVKDIFENGILYFQCANAGKRQYFVFTINDEGYEWENIEF